MEVTDATFEVEVMSASLPVLIDLYADWCGPCKQMAPVLAEIARELDGRAKVVKIDVDQNPACAQMFRVSSLPMFVAMQGGKVIGHQLGAVPKSALLELLSRALPSDPCGLEPDELARWLVNQAAVPVDLRDPGSFGRFRIPGAINIPLADLPERKGELRDGKVPVLYGRSNEGAEVVQQLAADGIEAKYLKDGLLAWEAADLEVERG